MGSGLPRGWWWGGVTLIRYLCYLKVVRLQGRGGGLFSPVADGADVPPTGRCSCWNVFPLHEEAKAATPMASPTRRAPPATLPAEPFIRWKRGLRTPEGAGLQRASCTCAYGAVKKPRLAREDLIGQQRLCAPDVFTPVKLRRCFRVLYVLSVSLCL